MKRRSNKREPRQWLHDRVNGVTLEGEERPPCFLCFPPLMLKCCPWLLEQNCCCTCLGSTGCCASGDDWARSTISKLGAMCNGIGFLGMLLATLALTQNEDLLIHVAAFAKASLMDQGNDGVLSESAISSSNATTDTQAIDHGTLEEMNIYLGLLSATFVNPNTFGQSTVPYDRFCDKIVLEGGLGSYMSPEDCGVCKDTTLARMIAVLVALVAIVPTFGIDVTRAYGNFDVNCQKFTSALLSFLTLVGCFVTYVQFNRCLESFFEGPTYYDSSTGDVVDAYYSPDRLRVLDFDWEVGYGLVGLFLAVSFKLMHVICNCCIPTPIITRSKEEQEEYERLAQESDDEDSLYNW